MVLCVGEIAMTVTLFTRRLSKPIHIGLGIIFVLLFVMVGIATLCLPRSMERVSPDQRWMVRVTYPVGLGKILPLWHPTEMDLYLNNRATGEQILVSKLYSGNQGIADTVDRTPMTIIWDRWSLGFRFDFTETAEPIFEPRPETIWYQITEKPFGAKEVASQGCL
jgi:hypothetical protein